MIFVKSFTQATFQQMWKFTRRMRKTRHFLPPKTLFLAFESQKCDIHSLSSWNMYFLHLTIPTLSKTSKNIWITQEISSPWEILPKVEISLHKRCLWCLWQISSLIALHCIWGKCIAQCAMYLPQTVHCNEMQLWFASLIWHHLPNILLSFKNSSVSRMMRYIFLFCS